MNNDIYATIINFDRVNVKNRETGEVTSMYSVNYALQTEPMDGHFGPVLLNSYASDKAFSKLQSCLGKRVKIKIKDKLLFGKVNTYKKVVDFVDDVNVRDFK